MYIWCTYYYVLPIDCPELSFVICHYIGWNNCKPNVGMIFQLVAIIQTIWYLYRYYGSVMKNHEPLERFIYHLLLCNNRLGQLPVWPPRRTLPSLCMALDCLPSPFTGYDSFAWLQRLTTVSSGEEQRKLRHTTVYTHDDWKKQHAQDRFIFYLAAIFKLGVWYARTWKMKSSWLLLSLLLFAGTTACRWPEPCRLVHMGLCASQEASFESGRRRQRRFRLSSGIVR